jgi:hypothetical protein
LPANSGGANTGGNASTGGTMSTGGTTASGGSAATGGAPGGCAPSNGAAFGCDFAWGTNEPQTPLSQLGYLDFVSKWVGYEVKADGSLPTCDGCTWLRSFGSTELIPVYYAYFIGFFGHANGLPDGNQNPNGPNLTTDAANLIRQHRAALIGMYAEYARRSREAWPDKPLVWLLEGDYVQYSGESQKNALTYAELGALARDTACAIKSNMPNAVVAINHSTWNPDTTTKDFWNAMSVASYDLVWTTGVPNNRGYFESGTNDTSYNHATATYAHVSQLTGKKLFVDTSFGLSAMADSWSTSNAATLNARIADGVVAVNVATPSAGYQSAIEAMRGSLNQVCR